MPTSSDNPPLSWSQLLTRMNIAAGFGAAFAAITGTVLTRYGQTLGMTPFGFGVLAAVPYLTALIQLPASYLVERFGHRRQVALLGVFVHRALWLAIAALPWLLPHAWWWPGLVVLMALSHTAVNIGAPAAVSWTADLVPSRLRGRYFALRGQLVRLINIPLCLCLGWAMDRAQAQGFHTFLLALSLMLAAAALLGMTESLLALALPDRQHQPRTDGLSFGEIFRLPLANPTFRAFLGYTGFITLATGFVGPFVWLYLIDVVGVTNTEATAMTMVLPSIISLLGMRLWGPLVDRWGYRRVLQVAGLLIINGATAWCLVTPETKWVGMLAVLVSATAWPGMELAAGNLLYALSESGKSGNRLGSAYAALNSAVVAVAGTVSGLFGGWLAEALAGWHTYLWGWLITYHGVLFGVSALLRLVALGWIWRLPDDRRRAKATPANAPSLTGEAPVPRR
jgi:MFS family permease